MIGGSWLCYISFIFGRYRITYFQSITCGIPAAFLLTGFMLIHSCIFKNKFITTLSVKSPFKNKIFPFCVDIISGSLLALGFLCILTFLSPPFPFVPSLTCATGWNDPTLLIPASFFLGLRYLLVRNKNKEKLS